MNAKQVYERVCLVANIGERQFFDRLNDTLGSLGAAYGETPKLLWEAGEDGEYPEGQWVKSLSDELVLLPLYHAALPDNILYLSGAGETYGQEFLRKSREAWLAYWNRDAKGRTIKGKEGGNCVRQRCNCQGVY